MNRALAVVLVWFFLALTLSLMGWFERFSAATLFGIGGLLLAGGLAILLRFSTVPHGVFNARTLKRLTQAQILRLFGALALVKTEQHVLPAIFAIPTGILDIVFALSSFFIAARFVSDSGVRPGFVIWHVLGLLALALSIILGILTSSYRYGLVEEGTSSQSITSFPMVLSLAFVGPLMMICHFLALHGQRQTVAQAGAEGSGKSRLW